MRNWDGLDDKNLEMGWGADSSGTLSPCLRESVNQLADLDDERILA